MSRRPEGRSSIAAALSLTSSHLEPAAAERSEKSWISRLPEPAPWWSAVGIVVLLGVGAVVLVQTTSGTTFWADEWQWILYRRGGGLATLLDPHNSHLSLVPVLIYKALFATVGMNHYWPYRAVLIGAQLACVLLVFIYARARVGGYAALLAAGLILFFGPGWQDILWPFQMAWLIAIAAGVAALLMLDRDDRMGDLAACALLAVSLASAGPGLAVAAGILVDVVQRRRRRDLWIALVPIALYAVWSLGYQSTPIYGNAILLLPQFVFNAAAGVLSSLTGLAAIEVGGDTGSYLNWGAPLLVVAVIAMAWRLRVLGRIPSRVVSLAAIALGFWLLTGIGRAYINLHGFVLTSSGDESRYLYVGAVFVVLLTVELVRGRTPALWPGLVVGVLAVAAIVSNLGPLRDGGNYLRAYAHVTEAELAALNLDRPLVKPTYTSNGFVFGVLTAGPWFAAERDLGSQAAVPGPITTLPDSAQQAADQQLIKIQGLTVQAAPAGAARGASAPTVSTVTAARAQTRGGCVQFAPAAFTPSATTSTMAVTIPPAGVLIRNGPARATVGVRRFGSAYQPLGALAASSAGVLVTKPDGSQQPWRVQIAAAGPLQVCSRG
jgi:hypothetical protein